jgi:hypothetical protein
MRASLVPEQLDGFYWYLIFKNFAILCQRLVNLNIPARKIGALSVNHKIENGYFLKSCYNEFYSISVINKMHIGGIFMKITGSLVDAKTQSINFFETGPTSQTDFTGVWYSATNNGLPCNNQFRFEGNTVKVNHMRNYVQRFHTHFYQSYTCTLIRVDDAQQDENSISEFLTCIVIGINSYVLRL